MPNANSVQTMQNCLQTLAFATQQKPNATLLDHTLANADPTTAAKQHLETHMTQYS